MTTLNLLTVVILIACYVVPVAYTIRWGLRASKDGTYSRPYRCCRCGCCDYLAAAP